MFSFKKGFCFLQCFGHATKTSHSLPVVVPKAVIITGSNFRMEPMDLSHVSQLFNVGKNKDIWQWLPRKEFETIDDADSWVKHALTAKNQIPFVIFDMKTNMIIGSTRFLEIDPENRSLEVGYSWLDPNYWNTTANTECKFFLLQYIFEHLNYYRVQLKTDVKNIRSQKAIEKIGATKEGVLRSNMIVKDGRRRDSVYYSILTEEWPLVKERLTVLLNQPSKNNFYISR